MRTLLAKLASPFRLNDAGVMGMNQRNIRYIGRYNDRRLYPLVDDKLKTKLIAQQAGATVPDLIGVIDSQADVKRIHAMVANWPGFVIKPAQGSGGKGIMVITQNHQGRYFKASGKEVSHDDVERHITNTLAGLFSLGGKADVAVVENLIAFDDSFSGFSYEGVPDIRVIVFQGYPVMAMMRLSTSASDGKANLHQGAVGVGLDLATGHALKAVQFNSPITHHPDTHQDLYTLRVPHWQQLLTLAASAWEMTGLGYMGTDMVLDKDKGPMVLELNARPGLAIQIANGCGLLPRLRLIESLPPCRYPPLPEARVEFSMRHFAGQQTQPLKPRLAKVS
ncbi:alpha-L-glutamate ligase-like protein [Salinivibrio proteolyticus]|uniref:alpha-L-glutamate ligase-like protein n=1 Tax=Salinivibrio proteolyticus TaxID=334715 RepID=UPI0009899C47|nr:alpha-L-glutamate ligase-like protein [Salinivibrio proteolyticus]OOF27821.1 alpha-L-glutamate ligase-like protein [Salinivibrio proteolyticus]